MTGGTVDIWTVDLDLPPDSVCELLNALSGEERVLIVLVEALGDRPGAVVLPGPEGAARMDEEDFDARVAAPKEQQPGAALRHR